MVPADKPYITVSGMKATTTIITWEESGGIFDSPTFSVLASDFVGRYLTIQVSRSFPIFSYSKTYLQITIWVAIKY